jgi:hypothetical protein
MVISPVKNLDGSQFVFINVGKTGQRCVGRLMPQVDDSRQQPKSLAEKLVVERRKTAIWRELVGFNRLPPRSYRNTLAFHRFGNAGAEVFDVFTRQAYGTIMPTVPREALGYGIQSWSIPVE